MNDHKQKVTVDAGPLLSALRGGKPRAALFSGKFVFITAEHTTWEVKKYIPELANESGVNESELFHAFDRFPIIAFPPIVYDEKRQDAVNLISHRDPRTLTFFLWF